MTVALRKESVDRNGIVAAAVDDLFHVALRKESVDRNREYPLQDGGRIVALRKESVDRNAGFGVGRGRDDRSLSARRAWIEIWVTPLSIVDTPVALRKESVDRNCCDRLATSDLAGRSPQGERG